MARRASPPTPAQRERGRKTGSSVMLVRRREEEKQSRDTHPQRAPNAATRATQREYAPPQVIKKINKKRRELRGKFQIWCMVLRVSAEEIFFSF
jgi:hypothetical protein